MDYIESTRFDSIHNWKQHDHLSSYLFHYMKTCSNIFMLSILFIQKKEKKIHTILFAI